MDDMMSKLSQIMSDEESRRQIEELAQMLSSEIGQSENDSSDDGVCSSMPDFAAISKLIGAFDKGAGSDKNQQLLIALRAHLCPERQERIDRAIKLMKVIDMAKTAKESGLLENLI